MPLQSSGPISLANLQTEFGGTNPISISEYYRGGGLVPAGASASIPTSGPISISNFYGGAGGPGPPTGTVRLTAASKTINSIVFDSMHSASYAGFALGAGGKLFARANEFAANWFEITPADEWLEPESETTALQYECRATSAPPGLICATDLDYGFSPTNWTRLGSINSGGRGARYWFLENFETGTIKTATFVIEIRQVGTTTVLASVTISLSARLRGGAIE